MSFRPDVAAGVWVREADSDDVSQEVRRRQQAEAALRESEARLHRIVHAAMDAIISVDERQHVVVFNAAAEQMFRCPAVEAIGRPLDRFIPARHREAHRSHIREFGSRGVTSRRMGALGELTAVRADGEEFPIEASISHSEVSGQKLFTVILRDITERKRGENELRRAFAELGEAVADRETLLREVHHRTKNNLQMICDMLFLEAELLQDAAGRQALEKSYTRVYAFARLHEQLHRSLHGGQIHLGEYLVGIAGGFQQVYPDADIRLDLPADQLDLDLDRTIHIGLIVNELVTNAVKHAFQSGTRGEIGIAVRLVDGQIVLRVWDTGKGLPANFDPTHVSTLGLRIVTLLARRLEAQVKVGNGVGTSFRISFPLSPAA